jgi:hypothetical protein
MNYLLSNTIQDDKEISNRIEYLNIYLIINTIYVKTEIKKNW